MRLAEWRGLRHLIVCMYRYLFSDREIDRRGPRGFVLLWEDGDLYYSSYDGWECRDDRVCAVYEIANVRVNDMQLCGWRA